MVGRITLIVGLLILSGCGPPKEQQKVDAYNAVRAHLHKGEYDKVVGDCTELIRIDPNDAIAYSSRGSAYNMKGEYDKAIADFTKAVDLDPRDGEVHYWLGQTYGLKGDDERAKPHIIKAKQLGFEPPE